MTQKKPIYEPDEIKAVFDYLKTEKNIIDITESNGISTIYTDSLVLLRVLYNIYLQDKQIVTINKINYSVDNVDLDLKSFEIEAVNLYHMSTDAIPVKVLDATKWNLAINFDFGSRIEVNQVLMNEVTDPDKKLQRFPLAWLLINQPEKSKSMDTDHISSVKMVFAHLTDPTYLAEKRKEQVLKTVLDPLYTLFVETIRSPYFRRKFRWNENEFIETKYNRYFYGSSDKQEKVFDSPTDAIEIELDVVFENQYY